MNYYEQNLKLESIIELFQILNQQSSFEEILRIISVKAIQLFDADSAMVMMLNPQTEHTIKTIYKEQKDSFIQDYHLLNVNLAEKCSNVIAPFLNKVEKIEEFFTCPLTDDDLINKYAVTGLIGNSKRF